MKQPDLVLTSAERKTRAKELLAAGDTVREVADRVGFSMGTVSALRNGKDAQLSVGRPKALSAPEELEIKALVNGSTPKGKGADRSQCWSWRAVQSLIATTAGKNLQRPTVLKYLGLWDVPNGDSSAFARSNKVETWWAGDATEELRARPPVRTAVLWLAEPVKLSNLDWSQPSPYGSKRAPKHAWLLAAAETGRGSVHWRMFPGRLTWRQHYLFLRSLQLDFGKRLVCIPVRDGIYTSPLLTPALEGIDKRRSPIASQRTHVGCPMIDLRISQQSQTSPTSRRPTRSPPIGHVQG